MPKLVYPLSAFCAIVLAFFGGLVVGQNTTRDITSSASSALSAPAPEQTPHARTTPTATTPTPTPTPTGLALTSRGTIVLKAGEAAEVNRDGNLLASLIIESIEVDPTCTGGYVRPPKNGHFVVLTGTITTGSYADFADMPYVPSISLRTGGFSFVSTTGKKTPGNNLIGDSYGCFPEEEMMPNDVNIGENASGKLIFDVPENSGSIVLPELGAKVPNVQGWEWTF